jgi:hypothetical protein
MIVTTGNGGPWALIEGNFQNYEAINELCTCGLVLNAWRFIGTGADVTHDKSSDGRNRKEEEEATGAPQRSSSQAAATYTDKAW